VAVSEQALAEQSVERLPEDAVVLGDGNFGIFAFAYKVQQSQRPMILRLTQARAQKILGSELVKGTDRKVVWQASRWDRDAHPQLPEQASVEGRLVVCANPSRPDELLYLFTTLDLPVEEILGIYKLRWNVETDLRSLKRTVGLHRLSSKSLDTLACVPHGGKRTVAGDGRLQFGARRYVLGGTACQPYATPAQLFLCANGGGSGLAGFRPCGQSRGIPAAAGSPVALCGSGQTPPAF
jgi:hypothetical protein